MGRATAFLRTLIVVAALAAGALAPAAAADITKQTLAISGRDRAYYLYVPDSAKGADAPVLLLLHGSGGNGLDIASLWKDKADCEGIVLVAPDAWRNDAWRPKDDTPHVLGTMINDAATHTGVDFRRLYLFGQSGGAVYALLLAMIESRAFAAMAIHAGSWRAPSDFKMIALATRRMPLKIIIGDQDEYFSLASVRQTEDALKKVGFPIAVEIVPGQHHGFNSETAAGTEESAWAFLKDKALDAPPVFTDYGP
ncbi:MAG TPA: dienelactone hydrolase family protein [Rhizomicrobium sp.]|nr:dienelactone hydrolase family protein [Rhizomicrobium sp.]